MSASRKAQPLTPSTIEAIRMASVSVLGLTTRRGHPLGSAVGSGSMMEQNADAVAMGVGPLIFSVRDSLYDAEDLELLSVEWDLEHSARLEMVPEQLLVAGGGLTYGLASHACILGWERGIIDPFKMDEYIERLTKKMGDIEAAVEANRLDYETQGLDVLRRFSDRLNKVLFVDLLDRRFQRTWDSLQIRPEQTDPEVKVVLEYCDDFTTLPPGVKVIRRKELEFLSPDAPEDRLIDQFKHRVLTPAGLRTLTEELPELGRALLGELNQYAYSIEETEIVRTAIAYLTDYLGTDRLVASKVNELRAKTSEFADMMKRVIGALRLVADAHVRSGLVSDMEGHKRALLEALSQAGLRDIELKFAQALVEDLFKSVSRGFPRGLEFRAWQMRSRVAHFLLYCERVASYFADQLRQYTLVSAAREAFVAALHEFRDQMVGPDTDAITKLLFEKFYSELYAQLNAVFDRKAFEGAAQQSFEELISLIADEMIEVFGRIDMWDLIEFDDVAEIARTEIESRYGEGGSLNERGQVLTSMLDSLSTLVNEIVPDIAQTLLSRPFVSEVIDLVREGKDLVGELYARVDSIPDKPDEWREEARRWIRLFEANIDDPMPLSQRLLVFQNVVHERAGTVGRAASIVVRVSFEAESRQREYDDQVRAWEEECARIEAENAPIIERNEKRQELSDLARQAYDREMAAYKAQVEQYEAELRRLHATGQPTDSLPRPQPPEPLQSRLARIEAEYPPGTPKPLPPKPQPSEELQNYTELRDLLTEHITEMDRKQESMEEVFAERLRRMAQDAASMADQTSVSLGEQFYEYLLDYTIRSLGRLFPLTTRAFLRDTGERSRIHLVTFEHHPEKGELVVTIGQTVVG